MSLPLARPFLPMEAKSATEMPSGADWEYEPNGMDFAVLYSAMGTRSSFSLRPASP